MKAMELRLARLERSGGAGWEAYRDRPLNCWPDAALLAFLGVAADVPDAELLRIGAGRDRHDGTTRSMRCALSTG